MTMLQNLGYEWSRHRYLLHEVYADESEPDENCATQIHNITNDIQITKYPVVVPLRHPGATLSTGGLTHDSDESAIEQRLAEFGKFRETCEDIEMRGEVLYFPVDAGLSEDLLFQQLLTYTGAEGQPLVNHFPREGRTGKGDTLFMPNLPAMVAAVEFYNLRVDRVRESLGDS
jgi:hypothetical protein